MGYVAYAVGQHMGWISKELSFLDSLKLGWEGVGDAILGTQNATRSRNEIDLAAEIAKLKAGNSESVLNGAKTQAQADDDNRKGEIMLREKWAREDQRIGDKDNMVKNQEAAARLRQTAMPPAVIPIAPSAAATDAMPFVAVAVAPSVSDASSTIHGTSSARKKALDSQVKKDKAAAANRQRNAKKQEKEEDKLLQERRETFADVALEQLKTDTETAIARLEAQKSKKGKSPRDRALDFEIERLKAAQEVEEARIKAGTMSPLKAQAAQKIAAIHAAGIMAKARIGLGAGALSRGTVQNNGRPEVHYGNGRIYSGWDAASAVGVGKYLQNGNGYDGAVGMMPRSLEQSGGSTPGDAARGDQFMNVRANAPIITRTEDGRWRISITVPDFFVGEPTARALRNAKVVG